VSCLARAKSAFCDLTGITMFFVVVVVFLVVVRIMDILERDDEIYLF
jgi:hypothetical protein